MIDIFKLALSYRRLILAAYQAVLVGRGEGYVHTISIPDSSCAGTKTIPDKASVHT